MMEVEVFERVRAVDTVLRAIRGLTGMRIVLVARIRNGEWTAMAVLDDAGFGLRPGDALPLETTY